MAAVTSSLAGQGQNPADALDLVAALLALPQPEAIPTVSGLAPVQPAASTVTNPHVQPYNPHAQQPDPSLAMLDDLAVYAAPGTSTTSREQDSLASFGELLCTELSGWSSSSLPPDPRALSAGPMASQHPSLASSFLELPAWQAPVMPQSTQAGPDQGAVSDHLREMASQGTPASMMLQYLSRARNGTDGIISAEAVLQGMIEHEQGEAHSLPSATSPTSSHGWHRQAGLDGASPPVESSTSHTSFTGAKLYQCDQCPLVFDRTFNLREHLKTHNPDRVKAFLCPLDSCNQASYRRADLHRHIKAVHINKEKLSPASQRKILAACPSLRSELLPRNKQGSRTSQ